MKIRIERTLYNRARDCADAVGDPVADWIAKAIRQDAAERYPHVDYCDETPVATRGSVVARVNCPAPLTARELHGILQRACAFCEARRPRIFSTPLREGHDYFIAPPEK